MSIPDETLVAALIQHGTIKEAAAAAGTAPRTLYDRMRTPGFIALYAEARNDILRTAVTTINGRLAEAVSTVADIMNDSSINPATRLQAAQTIIKTATNLSQRLAIEEENARSPYLAF